MKKRICWLDLETSSLSPKRGRIIQIRALCARENEILSQFNHYMKHEDYGPDYEKTLAVHGITKGFLDGHGLTADEVRKKFLGWLNNYFKQEIEYQHMGIILAGKAINFDKYFVSTWLGSTLFNRYFHYHSIDVTGIVFFSMDCGALPEGGASLKTIAAKLGIALENAHNSLEDIKATFKIYTKLVERLQL
jgi:DNA polymerase III epsilon subunit-like protein